MRSYAPFLGVFLAEAVCSGSAACTLVGGPNPETVAHPASEEIQCHCEVGGVCRGEERKVSAGQEEGR